ncbi:MAG: glycosyltransferase involved in cell wall biosynthesis [Arenicella sp.]|jgi:glycosyltransferase involved in cell wall biosynthesis
MLDQSKLLELNPQLGLLNDIYQDTSNVFRESMLSNYIQIAVTDVFTAAKDKSLFSLDVETRLQTDELRTVLAANRHNYLLSLNLKGINHALDLSEDMGGVAHFLSDHVNTVDAVKIDCGRTRLAVQRCANKQNICHISHDLEKLVLPTKHYDLIVIAELEALGLKKDDQIPLLAKLQASLSDSGVLIINVRNRERISKWLDSANNLNPESIAYQDLYSTDFELEFDRKELLDTLASANFSTLDFNATLSQGDRCQNLFSEDYLCSNLNAKNHYYRLGAIENSQINEYLLFKNLDDNRQRVFDRASRFIVFAGSSTSHTRRIYNNDFSHYPGTGRKPQWRALTQRSRSAGQVSKTAVYPDYKVTAPEAGLAATVSQDLSPQVFYKGRLLIEDWIQAVFEKNHPQLRELIVEYSEYLHDLAKQDNFTKIAYDLLPFNIVLNERGGARQYQLIDTEWSIEGDFGADFVVFRALFWFAFENKALLKGFAEHNNISSIASFVAQYLPAAGYVEELQKMVELEESLQSQIGNDFRAKSVEHALLQSFDGQSQTRDSALQCQVLWGNADGVMDLESAVFCDWEANDSIQTLSIDLPKYTASKPFLRIDPIDGRGIFSISSLALVDAKNKPIHKLETLEAVKLKASCNNAKVTKTGFVALNADPHLVFDMQSVPQIETATSLVVEIALLHDDHYDTALSTLSDAVGDQNRALLRNQNTLNEYRSELEFTKLRLAEAIEHRSDLNSMYQELDQKKRQQLHTLNLRVINLSDQLNAQLGRNQEMEAFLMTRPSTRAKRFAARTLARLTGNTVAPQIDAQEVDAQTQESKVVEVNVDPNAFPQSGELLGQNTEDYQLWVRENSLSQQDIVQIKQEIEDFELKPVFSILVPIYNTDPEYLIPMIRSVQAQIYPHWQLCLVDDASPKGYLKRILEHEAAQDPRISIQLNDHNQGIALTTNDALAMAVGDYIALLDHDDELSIDALYENAKAINQYPDIGLAYSDEDKMDMQGNRLEPYFKPDYSPDLLNTNNYVCHFTVIKKEIADEIGGFQDGLDGSQDHDIILRSIQKSERVVHIPKILYHWRKIPGSTAVSYDSKSYAWEAGRKAIEHCLKKSERGVSVEFGTLKGTYRVRREIIGDPLVSIIIPFKDKPELLDSCLNSILDRSTYKNFEIIGVSNNSEDPLTFERMQHFSDLDSRITFVEKNIPFNFSAICNFGVSQANGEYSLLLNNDIEIITPGWIENLLEFAQRDDVGAVGGKLLFPDGRIQHAGVVAGMVGAAGHTHKFFPGNHIGYHGRLHMVNNVSAVTGAMLMLKTAKFKEVGGLDEDNLAVAYNDVDLCLKLVDKGYLNVFTPHCVATHHESISRGYEDTQEKLDRLIKEQNHFLNKWSDFLAKGDPFYNPNLSLKNERFSLNFRD